MIVSIIIPNWNGATLLSSNLPCVIKAKRNLNNRIAEIIVVDDGSTDDSLNVLSKFGDEVKVIKHTKNRGFSFAVNTGVRFAGEKLLCLLNTDVVPEPDFLESVIPLFKNKNLFAATLHERGYGAATGNFLNGLLQHSSVKETKTLQETLWASGGSSVFSKKIWKKLRGLDEVLYSPFYWEDVDLGYRAHKRGYSLVWVPSARVTHKHESVINTNSFKKSYLNIIKERNELLFIWKNITSSSLFQKHKKYIIKRVLAHPGYLKVVAAALLKYPKVAKARRREIKESNVSDEAVFSKFN
ncbi:glycosyltransferase family 2 protein [Candidatus Microgenomates bacterium]|nr:MAG: glycosyltransferase family 2 protein [Candidatus Microgenomates bacterium]